MTVSHDRRRPRSIPVQACGKRHLRSGPLEDYPIFVSGISVLRHSMATANLNKSKDFVTNTTTASKYIPRRLRISNNPSTPHFIKFQKKFSFSLTTFFSGTKKKFLLKFYEVKSERGDFN